MHDDLDRARAESAELLGLNPDKLTPAGALKCELVSALRSVVDDELGKVDRANAADLSRLIVAVEALTKFLKESPADERSEDDEDGDPHERLMRIIDNWIAADEAEKAERVAQGLPANETEALRLENASLREEVARLRGLPAPDGERVIDPPTSDIVPPGEQGRLYVGPPPLGPDDPKPRSTAAIDGKAVPTGTTDAEREANRQRVNNDRSAYTQQGLRPAGGEPWRGHVGGVDESFFWGGSTGKRAW